MKIVTSRPLIGINGKAITTPEGDPATFATVAVDALSNRFPTDPDDDGKTAMACYRLAVRVSAQDSVDLSIGERALIKARVLQCKFNNQVTGRMLDMLEPLSEAKE